MEIAERRMSMAKRGPLVSVRLKGKGIGSARATSTKTHDTARVKEREDEQMEHLSQGSPLATNFWYSPTLEELAEAQHVKPVTNFDALLGDFWPDEDSVDEFVSSLTQWRRKNSEGEDQ